MPRKMMSVKIRESPSEMASSVVGVERKSCRRKEAGFMVGNGFVRRGT